MGKNDARMTVDGTLCIIDSTVTDANASGVYPGCYGGDNEMHMTDGYLDVRYLNIGRGDPGSGSVGYLKMTDGEIDAEQFEIPNQFSTGSGPISGHVDLFGGTINVSTDTFSMGKNGGTGSMDIEDGTLILTGDQVSTVEGYVDSGQIVAYGGDGVVDIEYDGSNTIVTASVFNSATQPYPEDEADGILQDVNLSWSAGDSAASHDVYFGTSFNDVSNATDPNTPPGRGNQTGTSYDPCTLEPNTTYYWRIDEKNSYGTVTGPVWSFTTVESMVGDLNSNWIVNILDLKILLGRWLDGDCGSSAWCEGADIDRSGRVDFSDYASLTSNMQLAASEFPYTDYCSMLSQEVQDKKHGFMAGNLVYYVGGHYACWDKTEDETLGLTHPFYHDLRSRGHGMVEHPVSGYGHDFQGWEFYKNTKVAYGTAIIDGVRYENPVPTEMYWRPDKMICEYNVGGVNIHEEKFIAENDVACSIITSDEPITLEFEGQSFVCPKSIKKTATCEHDDANNAVHIGEGGTTEVEPVRGEHPTGKLVYDGMSTVISASKDLLDYNQSESGGQWFYDFEVPCDSSGTAVLWAMADDYGDALARVKDVRSDPEGAMAAKTASMNDKLNYQIPYFRCSDQDIVDVYYYLWSIYLMYYIDVDQGWEDYPHTQTAVNNFLGMHRYDAHFQIKVGSWTADLPYYAYGNVLHWRHLLPYAKSNGRLPDNKGIAWLSPVWGATTEHVIGAWQIYQHSGDVAFVHDCYDDYFKPLFWDGMLQHWGCGYDAAENLHDMAVLTDDPNNPDHWYDVVNMDYRDSWLNNMWEKNDVKYFFGAGSGDLGWSGFAYLRNSYFPEDWAAQMTEYWAVDNVNGFYDQVPITTRALKDWTSDSPQYFAVTPDTNYYSMMGMFRHHAGLNAINLLLSHLKNYNMEWGIPVAPESYDRDFEPWGDQYSNFNAGKILLILEGLCGFEYSIPDETFTICDHMPKTWDYMEMMVPVTKNGITYWPHIEITRESGEGDSVEKTVQVTGCPLDTLKVQPFLEEMTLASASDPCYTQGPKGHISYTAAGPDFNVALNLDDTSPPWPDPADWKVPPHATGSTSIAMEALLGIDKDGVEYFFECTTDSNFDSGWQDELNYEATGLSSGTSYTFRVKARDKSSGQYETDWSDSASATTE